MPQRLAFASLSILAIAALPAAAEVRTYDVGNFDGIDVSAGIEVRYVTGASRSVEVDDETLVLKRQKKMNWGSKRQDYSVTVLVQSLSDIEASSGSYVEGSGLSGEEASIDVSSGARTIVTGISAGEIDIETSSGSSVEASGTCSELEADASSGSTIDAGALQCTALVADVSSGASIRAHASERVDAEASSGGSIRVTGGATDVTIDKSSGGSVTIG